MSETSSIGFDDIQKAAARLLGHAVRTPLLTSAALDAHLGQRVFLKPEMLQVAGSFKFRGAYNRISQLSATEKAAGVIAWSSGNHAQGVAAAARSIGVRATIVMPEDAPAIKIANTRALGGEIVFYDRYGQDREEIAYDLAARQGGVIVPSYDDPYIIAGQGTAGLEIFTDVESAGARLDALLVCCGGGGLIAGCGIALQALSPATHLFAVEPEGYDDHARSLLSGTRERADITKTSICDALLAPCPGSMTFPINKEILKGGLVVSDAEVRDAVAFAFETLKLVVEPGGAVALAALLSGKVPAGYKTVGVMLSGGNIDPQMFADIIG